jgi:DNA-binding transcriptional LysR family regulator
MDFFQLETFLAIVQTRSFSGAAKVVRRTQPAVSQMVRKLEEEVGEPLFDRSSRDGTLTDAGKVLQEYANRIPAGGADFSRGVAPVPAWHAGHCGQ